MCSVAPAPYGDASVVSTRRAGGGMGDRWASGEQQLSAERVLNHWSECRTSGGSSGSGIARLDVADIGCSAWRRHAERKQKWAHVVWSLGERHVGKVHKADVRRQRAETACAFAAAGETDDAGAESCWLVAGLSYGRAECRAEAYHSVRPG